MFPNRKRRYRKSQEIHDTNSTTCSVASPNGEIRKKSDLSCVGKLFFWSYFKNFLKVSE